jgi:hypothetical protein
MDVEYDTVDGSSHEVLSTTTRRKEVRHGSKRRPTFTLKNK